MNVRKIFIKTFIIKSFDHKNIFTTKGRYTSVILFSCLREIITLVSIDTVATCQICSLTTIFLVARFSKQMKTMCSQKDPAGRNNMIKLKVPQDWPHLMRSYINVILAAPQLNHRIEIKECFFSGGSLIFSCPVQSTLKLKYSLTIQTNWLSSSTYPLSPTRTMDNCLLSYRV